MVRPRLTGGARREQVLDAAKDLVGEVGLHGLSIEAVARRAGITRPIVYEHFHDRAGLLEALIERETRRAMEQLQATLPTRAEPRRLEEALRGYLQTVSADPVTWRLVLMPPEGAPPMLRERVAQGRAAAVAVLSGVAGAELDSPDPHLTARVFSTLADEAARLVLTDAENYPIERIVRHAGWMLARLQAGLSRPGRLPAPAGSAAVPGPSP